MKTKKNKLTYSSLSLGLNNIVNFILGSFDVYYHISRSIMSLNYVSYVVI